MSNMDSLLTSRDLGQILRVDANTVRRWARAGLIPYITLPRVGIRFDRAAVMRALTTQHAGGKARG